VIGLLVSIMLGIVGMGAEIKALPCLWRTHDVGLLSSGSFATLAALVYAWCHSNFAAAASQRLAYNGRVDRANAIRLLKALVAAGANSNTLMVNTWVDDMAQREVSLRSTELSSALVYAEGQGWLADGPRQGWTLITHEGEKAARLRIV
jgi:hypothetical protein